MPEAEHLFLSGSHFWKKGERVEIKEEGRKKERGREGVREGGREGGMEEVKEGGRGSEQRRKRGS